MTEHPPAHRSGPQEPAAPHAEGQALPGAERPTAPRRIAVRLTRRRHRPSLRVHPLLRPPVQSGPRTVVHEPEAPGAIIATAFPGGGPSNKPGGPGGPDPQVWPQLDITDAGFKSFNYIYRGTQAMRAKLGNISGNIWNTVNRL